MREITLAKAVNEAIAEEMRRDPTVFVIGEDIAEAVEALLHDRGPRPEGGEREPSGRHCIWVAVDPDEAAERRKFEQSACVAAGADRGVQDLPIGDRLEQLGHLGEQHWGVDEGGLNWAHTQPLGQRCPGISPRVHRAGRVEKGTPGLLVKGLRISPGSKSGAL